MHHYNVLRAQRADWLVIDPKGLLGDDHFDICQFFRNPRTVADGVNRRRLDIFTDKLGFNRDRAKQWLFVHPCSTHAGASKTAATGATGSISQSRRVVGSQTGSPRS